MSAESDGLTTEQIEAMVEEVIEANTVWPDPLPSQVSAVMDIVREAMEQAWDEGYVAADFAVHRGIANPCAVVDRGNPYRAGVSEWEGEEIRHCEGCGEDYNAFTESHVGHVIPPEGGRP